MINIQNIDDNECFKWCLVRHLHPADDQPARITKADKDFAKKLDFQGRQFPVKIRDIHRTEKSNSIGISVFGYENNVKYPIYVSKKCCDDKHVLVEEERKRHYDLIKDFNTLMYDYTLLRRRKHFCGYCLQAFKKAET